jgi:hypothetical protein
VINQVTVAARPLAAVPSTDPERLFQTEVDNLTRLATMRPSASSHQTIIASCCAPRRTTRLTPSLAVRSVRF